MITIQDRITKEYFDIPVAISLEYTFFRLSMQSKYRIIDIKFSAYL